MMRVIKMALLLCGALGLYASCDGGLPLETTEGEAYTFEKRKAAITSRWNELKPQFKGTNYYDESPKWSAPYAAGSLKSAYLN
ncbi:MAG: hypothetical protein LBC77_07510, partial [Spirochaetaceae bacterium]|nr:hypothetical protein [Spirochaetaceae bacterium]